MGQIDSKEQQNGKQQQQQQQNRLRSSSSGIPPPSPNLMQDVSLANIPYNEILELLNKPPGYTSHGYDPGQNGGGTNSNGSSRSLSTSSI